MRKTKDIIASTGFKEFGCFKDIMLMFLNDRDAYANLVQTVFSKIGQVCSINIENARDGYFDLILLQNMMLERNACRSGVNNKICGYALSSAIEWGFVCDIPYFSNSIYIWNADAITRAERLDIIDRALIDQPSYTVETCKNAVVKISVSKDGDEFLGTGFIVKINTGDEDCYIIVTAKHNIDKDDNITIESIEFLDGTKLKDHKRLVWHYHPCIPDMDFAFAKLSCEYSHYFRLGSEAMILDEVISLGFPKVPTARDSYLLAHKGEVNSIVSSYLKKGEHILISNSLAPGSSGGPILLVSGLVVGIATDSFENISVDKNHDYNHDYKEKDSNPDHMNVTAFRMHAALHIKGLEKDIINTLSKYHHRN